MSEVEHGVWRDTSAYRGQVRTYAVYTPPRMTRGARLMVFQDGGRYARFAPAALDSLIRAKAIAPIVGVFVDPMFGEDAASAKRAGVPAKFSRAKQYNPPDNAYARFLLDELLPGVAQRHKLRWSDAPDDHALCGFSCGAVASFTAAWHRPDQFRRVVAHCAAFVPPLCEGTDWPGKVAAARRKPLRVFVQAGRRDNKSKSGSFIAANEAFAGALAAKRYDHRFVVGNRGHDLHDAAALFPETLRWLWS